MEKMPFGLDFEYENKWKVKGGDCTISEQHFKNTRATKMQGMFRNSKG